MVAPFSRADEQFWATFFPFGKILIGKKCNQWLTSSAVMNHHDGQCKMVSGTRAHVIVTVYGL